MPHEHDVAVAHPPSLLVNIDDHDDARFDDHGGRESDTFTGHWPWFNSTRHESSAYNIIGHQRLQAHIPQDSRSNSEVSPPHNRSLPNNHNTRVLHPLRSPSISPKTQKFDSLSPPTDGVTRPHLTRLLSQSSHNISNSTDTPEQVVRPNHRQITIPNGSELNHGSDEATVIEHTVTPNDSLPGVALRYGVPLAALRRANHLWPADPIHLRTVLYIPVDALPKRTHYNADTIRRVPVSSLSYFPPSTTSNIPLARTLTLQSQGPSPIAIPRMPTLASLIASIPARLSFESNISTDEEALELDEVEPVSRISPSSARKENVRGRMAIPSYNRSMHEPPLSPKDTRGKTIPLSEISTSPRTPITHDRLASGYDAHEITGNVVRTAQLEPSPQMKLPTRPEARQDNT